MADGWCYSCGGDHIAPRGKGCKKPPAAGHTPMVTRRKAIANLESLSSAEAAAAVEEEVNKSMAEVHPAEKFSSRHEYMEYLEALEAAQEEEDRVDLLEEKIRGRIKSRVERGKPRKKTPPPPPSRDPSPFRHPPSSTPLFDPQEGRDPSADRLTRLRKKFDLKRFTRGREPRSLLYPELMYVSLQWGCVGMDEGTFNSLPELRKFLRHLAYISFKASSDLYDKEMFAEYDADVREECVWGEDIGGFGFGVDHLIKKCFDTEGLKKVRQEAKYDHNRGGQGRGRGRGRGSYDNANRGSINTPAAPRNAQGIRVTESGEVMSCNRFNGAGCDARPCDFAHVCGKCGDPTHKARSCTNVRMYTQ